MPVHLDPRCYPHLVEAILFNVSDHITWLAARLVSTAMLKLVDPLLCGHRLDIISDSNGKRKILSSDWPFAHPLWRTWQRVPYLYEGGNRETQAAALRRVTSIFVDTDLVSPHVNNLMQHLLPSTYISISHFRVINNVLTFPNELENDLRIPPCKSVRFDVCPRCPCCGTGVLEHSSPSISLHIWPDIVEPDFSSRTSRQSNCAIIAGAINPGVKVMSVEGDVFGLPALLRGVELEIQASPDLQVYCECWNDDYNYDPIEAAKCRREIADLLKIPKEQVDFF
ncbi:hypothetical protein A1Q2_00429 [Trichosporon asahii var. asahii CBS 8904]|uniref:F-box domain-containing protein n=2 Tax=Trichosporon asahii var. asahii TaxID=189963 RepID=K1WWX0_TRIAC|nr:hypothetical protein A1Q1_04776 [Trichosporon asahii var. asahii CBS 2479]EJT46599.1 hypothetical protein A1Q1_04776 [Trichosporon asahii var. asahii CBS 2479]EKD05199.1 hypothetical protein A1Q2_00429 [Trichosporon asahii var. asahii CBS 8904]